MASLIPSLTLLLVSTSLLCTEAATDTSASSPAPSSAPSDMPADIVTILRKGRQFGTFLQLLQDTHVANQIQSQLYETPAGITILAPTDAAFSSLKPGTLNTLTAQELAALALFHVLTKYNTLDSFVTAANPTFTQASGNGGQYTMTVMSSATEVNITTGVTMASVGSFIYEEFPLAVFPLDKVLLPYDLFGPKLPGSAPAPKSASNKNSTAGGASEEAVTASSALGFGGGRVLGGWVAAGIGLVWVWSLL